MNKLSKLRESELYQTDIENVAFDNRIDWHKLENQTILITGSTGSIGVFLIDTLVKKNLTSDINAFIIASGRNNEKLDNCFGLYQHYSFFKTIGFDICGDINLDGMQIDYIIHAAGIAHPQEAIFRPVETFAANVVGTYNILKYVYANKVKGMLLLSSLSVYGFIEEAKTATETFYGKMDWSIINNTYAESKRAAELLARSYVKEYGISVVIIRLCKVFGPTFTEEDDNPRIEFIRTAVNKKNIVLKSDGEQMSSYLYISDAISGLLMALLKGESGEIYNISSSNCNAKLSEFVEYLARAGGVKVEKGCWEENENIYGRSTYSIICADKLGMLGWQPLVDLQTGIEHTVGILRGDL